MLRILELKRILKENSKKILVVNDLLSFKDISLNPTKAAFKICIMYMTIGSLWILLSDKVLEVSIDDIKRINILQTYKGWTYIIVTGVISFLFIKNLLTKIQFVSNKLYESYHELNLAYQELIVTKEDLKNKFQEIKLSKEALAESEERYQLAVEGANGGIWDWDIKSNKMYISSRAKNILDYEDFEGEYSIEVWKSLLHPDDKNKAIKTFYDYLNKKADSYNSVYRLRTQNGNYKWILSRGQAIWDENDEPIRIAGSHTDITEQKINEEKFLKLAYYDLITGLPNRAMFEKELIARISYAKKTKTKCALLYFDLDDFKNVNDTLGHTYGDALLKMVAKELKEYKKEDQLLARLGGDEFALIVSNIENLNNLHNLADTIVSSLEKPWILNGQEFYISASIGIAIFPCHGQDFQTLLRNADTAMYCAKEEGKKGYKIYKEEMYIKKIEFINMKKSLRYGVKNEEFFLTYQSVVDLKKDQAIGSEALIRWNHPKKGLISPDRFIPIAEKTGIIKEIGKWVLETACKQNKIWIDKGYKPTKISINMSALEFKQINFVSNIKRVLEETGLDSKYLVIEITENIVLENLNQTIEILNELKKMKIKIALDDFGTGYSSLNYLRILPIDFLKLDKTFINNVTKKCKDRAITESLIKLAHDIGLKVVAEGIETEEQYHYLKNINCDLGQGYLFNRPLPSNEFEKILEKGLPFFAQNKDNKN
ncbi:bifunctional diguanylate cyclase/phosphodiesterase [Paramaledivibacter caminithermalis]|jgi:diguanylate cyclase (GGDEF)-like protein/PAS domain S-box-containing protein|uniref:PAS domain S-box-containing protein/diguanylate cyclase (GGDEF) domain-containing protein n=1 Tax=Paramaledivibacter caminithermalis (strain DSM 15212 / CIP 107654 / DViRD3) TaxID=1121301 RepID=A0A1M6SQL4_PARC5|nr:GGDEF domain-containing phosphodiesterase [Paramaledivibacter caminithermalis]SHK47032.1 PAS domain S-box-containing protein/diguanylate cyclase (GGDEF) domain-containing protein [Paramaledivibacter caminithermalis DSM 15212]